MANTITGRLLHISAAETIPTRNADKPLMKRSIILDCTRHDPYTGERSQYENTPQLEFTGDICKELDTLTPGDIVTVSFDIQGRKYTSRDGSEKIFTSVRPYKVELTRAATLQPQQSMQPAPQQAPDPFDNAPF